MKALVSLQHNSLKRIKMQKRFFQMELSTNLIHLAYLLIHRKADRNSDSIPKRVTMQTT